MLVHLCAPSLRLMRLQRDKAFPDQKSEAIFLDLPSLSLLVYVEADLAPTPFSRRSRVRLTWLGLWLRQGFPIDCWVVFSCLDLELLARFHVKVALSELGKKGRRVSSLAGPLPAFDSGCLQPLAALFSFSPSTSSIYSYLEERTYTRPRPRGIIWTGMLI
jgi:hypothetical protein